MSRRWTPQEDVKLNHLVRQQVEWREIVKHFPGRLEKEIRSHYVHRFTDRLQKLWIPDDDQKLIDHFNKFGFSKWVSVARQLGRSVRECKDHWVRHIAPKIENTSALTQIWTESEDCEILRLFQLHGSNWGLISNKFRSRSADEIRNRWETRLRRRYKYSQSSLKSNVGIRVTVVRKGEDEWNQHGEEPTYLLPKNEAEDLGYFKSRNRSPLKVVQPYVTDHHPTKKKSKSEFSQRRHRSPFKKHQTSLKRSSQHNHSVTKELPDVSLQDIESEFSNISSMISDGDFDDLGRLDMDLVNFLGISGNENDNAFGEFSSGINQSENIPCSSASASIEFEKQQLSSLQIPTELSLPEELHNNVTNETNSKRSECSSSPSPTTPEYWSELVKCNSNTTERENQVSDLDDREEFIRKFKREVEKDFTELKMKGSCCSGDSFNNENLFPDENKPPDSPPTLKSYIRMRPRNEVSELVTSVNRTSSISSPSSSFASAINVKAEPDDSSPPAKRRIVNPRYMRRFSSDERRLLPSRISTAAQVNIKEEKTTILSNSSNDTEALKVKYDPVRFSFRRVLQIGVDRRWRHVALGSSRTQMLLTSQAKAFLRQHSS